MQSQPPQSPPEPDGLVLYPFQDIANCIGQPGVLSDLQYLRGSRETAVPPLERARAEQLVRCHEFRNWLQSPTSSQLLVHGHYRPAGRVSGLSYVCVSLADVLARYSDLFVPLTFFCGMHKDSDSDPRAGDPRAGGRALIRSLIYQLLGHMNRYLGTNAVAMTPPALHRVRTDDLEALNSLFAGLLSFLPANVTVYCVVDGAIYYEREEFWDDARRVLRPLLQLSGQTQPPRAPLKVLITSPSSTSYIRELFPDNLTLSLANRGSAYTTPSTAMIEREMDQAIRQTPQFGRP